MKSLLSLLIAFGFACSAMGQSIPMIYNGKQILESGTVKYVSKTYMVDHGTTQYEEFEDVKGYRCTHAAGGTLNYMDKFNSKSAYYNYSSPIWWTWVPTVSGTVGSYHTETMDDDRNGVETIPPTGAWVRYWHEDQDSYSVPVWHDRGGYSKLTGSVDDLTYSSLGGGQLDVTVDVTWTNVPDWDSTYGGYKVHLYIWSPADSKYLYVGKVDDVDGDGSKLNKNFVIDMDDSPWEERPGSFGTEEICTLLVVFENSNFALENDANGFWKKPADGNGDKYRKNALQFERFTYIRSVVE